MAATDWDGDGSTDSDCAPLDPAVHPGAADKPDLAFEDTNCDGIDGDKANAIFVTLGGDDGAPGTLTNPKHTISAAIAAAAASDPKKDVYVAGGNYGESVDLADGVGVYGGYEPITGLRNAVQVTSITGSPAAQATGESAVLQMLTLNGQADGSRNAYGLRALPNGATPSRLVLEKVTAKGLAAAAGADGGTGPTGATGLAGNNGATACVPGVTRFGPGGFGGAGGSGGNNAGGANGATGGTIGSAFGGLGGGSLGTLLGVGANGQSGPNGAAGPNNPVQTPTDAAAWPVTFAASGLAGGGGGGGGGGRGGTGDNNVGIPVCGGGGGSGGTGGGGGGGGGGGQNGGGSFGAYVFNSSIAAIESTFVGGTGGNGGNGGVGGGSGGGGGPSVGGNGDCVVFFVMVCGQPGANGGRGGAGGLGGGGGGGAGGPSVGLYQAGLGSDFAELSGTTSRAGTSGTGGTQGGSVTRAATGQGSGILRSAAAPSSSSADFDRDGINDSADLCPDTPRGASDTNGDGCPDRPAKLVDANGNGVPDSAEAGSNTNNTSSPTTTSGSPPSQGSPAPAPRVVAKITAAFKATKVSTKVTKLIASALRAGDKVNVTCKGNGCAFKSKTMKAVAGKATMFTLFKKRALRPKTVITISITRAGAIGQVVKFTVAKGKAPKRTNMCMPVGSTKPRTAC